MISPRQKQLPLSGRVPCRLLRHAIGLDFCVGFFEVDVNCDAVLVEEVNASEQCQSQDGGEEIIAELLENRGQQGLLFDSV